MMTARIKHVKVKSGILLLLLIVLKITATEIVTPTGIMSRAYKYDDCDSENVQPCQKEMVKEYLVKNIVRKTSSKTYYKEFHMPYEHFRKYLNCYKCYSKDDILKKMLLSIYLDSKRDTSMLDAYLRNAISSTFIDGGWSIEYEKIFVKDMEEMRKNQQWHQYYIRASALMQRSDDWFKYGVEVYHSTDTTHRWEKNNVYSEMIRRFDNDTNQHEKEKVESILYNVLKKDPYKIEEFDRCLQKISIVYRLSGQRNELCKSFIHKYNKYRKNEGMKVVFEYVDSVSTYLSNIKKYTEYAPPFKIE